jgi:hypothetical protein
LKGHQTLSLLASGLLACGGAGGRVASGPEIQPLDRAAVDALAREACPRVLTRTFPLENASASATTGKLWVRRCSARASPRALDIDVDVLGWQWVGEGSWGFSVREYVYFKASILATLRAHVDSDAGGPRVRVWSESPPEVLVHELGRVSARAEGPASSFLGVASALFGKGPNVLATSALRDRVGDLIRARAASGLEIALGETPAPGTPEVAGRDLLQETQALFPGGALISGSYPPNVATTLRFDVAANGTALARPVCVDEALALVDSVVAGAPASTPEAPPDVLTLRGHGELAIPARPCSWVLVTGVREDASVVAKVELGRARLSEPTAPRRWVRTTLLAYNVDGSDAHLFGFTTGIDGAPHPLGHPLTRAESPSVWLTAEPVEVQNGAPIVVEVSAWTPQPQSFWRSQMTFDKVPLGRASIVPSPGVARQERRAALERSGKNVGWVDVAFDAVEVE